MEVIATKPHDGMISVMATAQGFYDNRQIDRGMVFQVKESKFSSKWMKRLDARSEEHPHKEKEAK